MLVNSEKPSSQKSLAPQVNDKDLKHCVVIVMQYGASHGIPNNLFQVHYPF